MQATKCIHSALGALVAIVLSLSLMPIPALADEVGQITQDYTYMASAGEDSVEIPTSIEKDGKHYRLVSQSEPVNDEGWSRPTKSLSETRTQSLPADQASSDSAALKYFDSSLGYSDGDGYTGSLTVSSVVREPEYESLTRQVDRSKSFSGLPTNDANQLPRTQSFTVTSDASMNATTTKELELSDVTFTIDEVDEYGVPVSYTAQCNYRGTEDYLTIPGYTVTVTYSGVAELQDDQMVITATYEEEPSIIPEPIQEAIPDVPGIPWWAILLAILGAAAVIGTPIIVALWWRRTRARVYEVEATDEHLLGRVKVEKTGDGFEVRIPESMPINVMTDDVHVEVEMPKRCIDQAVKISQGDVVLFNGQAARRIRIVNPLVQLGGHI